MSTTTMLHRPVSAHCSRETSPNSSPSLRPLASSMAKSAAPIPKPPFREYALPQSSTSVSVPSTPVTSSLASIADNGRLTPPISPILPSRSFARAPPVRPYHSSSGGISIGSLGGSGRSMTAGIGARATKPVEGDTKRFAEQVVDIVEERSRKARAGKMPEKIDGQTKRKGRSLEGSLSGSYEGHRAEFIVDIPVWSPGCFQDLSTLHALRDTTLSHTHALLAYLQSVRGLPASYRLLARSANPQSTPSSPRALRPSRPASPAIQALTPQVGWGCIRLSPSPSSSKRDLKPHVRRSSMVIKSSSAFHIEHRGNGDQGRSPQTPTTEIPELRLDLDCAIMDDPDSDVEERKVELKHGYRSGGSAAGSEDESDDAENADALVAREVEKRGAKEGMAFLMTLFGQPALILT